MTRSLSGFSHETILGMLIDVIRDVADPTPIMSTVSKKDLLDQASMIIAEVYNRLAEADRQRLLSTLTTDKEH